MLDVTSATRVQELCTRVRPAAVIYTSYRLGDRGATVDGALHAARAAAAIQARFLFVSTDLVFDGQAGNYSEDTPAAPVMPYGQHKLEAEAHVVNAHDGAVVLRPALMVGETARHQRPAYECDLLARGEPCSLYADEWRSPVHVDDVARAAWDLVASDVQGLFHLGGPVRMSRLELGTVLCGLYGFDPALLVAAQRPAERPADVSLDSTRICDVLGWQPRPVDQAGLPELQGSGETIIEL